MAVFFLNTIYDSDSTNIQLASRSRLSSNRGRIGAVTAALSDDVKSQWQNVTPSMAQTCSCWRVSKLSFATSCSCLSSKSCRIFFSAVSLHACHQLYHYLSLLSFSVVMHCSYVLILPTPHHGGTLSIVCLHVRLSVCPVPGRNLRTESRRNLELSRPYTGSPRQLSPNRSCSLNVMVLRSTWERHNTFEVLTSIFQSCFNTFQVVLYVQGLCSILELNTRSLAVAERPCDCICL